MAKHSPATSVVNGMLYIAVLVAGAFALAICISAHVAR
jgi:hypothetical protein